MISAGEVPEFDATRLLLVGTGSISVADLPFWTQWLVDSYPDMQIKLVLTRTAARFVSPVALRSRPRTEVLVDEWAGDDVTARHVEWQEWADALVVYPATLDYLSRFANGLAGTPSLLAAQCTQVPVVLAPALPPGGADSPVFARVLRECADRPNVGIAPMRIGVSATTARSYLGVPALLPNVLELAQIRQRELSPAMEPMG